MSLFNYFSKKPDKKDNNDTSPGREQEPTTAAEYEKKFLDMAIEEKRKLYKCGNAYRTLDDIPLWPVLYKVDGPKIEKMIRSQRERKREHEFKFKEDKDIPVEPLQCNDALNSKVSLWQGDITTLEIDAIVNAANERLLGGGGVDGCIHRAAGDSLRKECVLLNGANTGEAKATCGHRLPAKYILHTVGPRGKRPDKLRECYENCFEIVRRKGLRSVALCCISTGVFGYPNRDAAHVALLASRRWLEKHQEDFDRVVFCVFLDQDFKIYEELMADKYFPCTPSEPDELNSEKETDDLKALKELAGTKDETTDDDTTRLEKWAGASTTKDENTEDDMTKLEKWVGASKRDYLETFAAEPNVDAAVGKSEDVNDHDDESEEDAEMNSQNVSLDEEEMDRDSQNGDSQPTMELGSQHNF